VTEELTDPLPATVHLFDAHTPAARLRARTKAGVRRTVFTLSPTLAERLFTVHYACACTRS
jgi:hypothetical protein